MYQKNPWSFDQEMEKMRKQKREQERLRDESRSAFMSLSR
jgi:hypothetical protein